MNFSSSPVRCVLFDLGNVLVHFCHERMCRQIGELFGIAPDIVRRDLFESGLHPDYERGRLTEDRLHLQLQQLWQREAGLEPLRQAAAEIFTLNEPMVPILDQLKQQGIRLVLLSNTNVTHYEWVRSHFQLLDRFDAQVLSFEVGAVKPEPAIFDAALQAIQCPPEACLYVDDIEGYVIAGRSHGLRGEVFTDHVKFLSDLRRHGGELTLPG